MFYNSLIIIIMAQIVLCVQIATDRNKKPFERRVNKKLVKEFIRDYLEPLNLHSSYTSEKYEWKVYKDWSGAGYSGRSKDTPTYTWGKMYPSSSLVSKDDPKRFAFENFAVSLYHFGDIDLDIQSMRRKFRRFLRKKFGIDKPDKKSKKKEPIYIRMNKEIRL